MPELLLELGVEELPASFVRRAVEDLRQGIGTLLAEAGLCSSEGLAYGTPRRIIVSFGDVLDRQPDSTKEQRGPALKAAFDADGNPSPALLGFCRSQGVEVSDLRRDEQYVWATKVVLGRPTAELLAEILPKAIRGLNFDKSMRWGSARMRFARPIRWILAVFDGAGIPFTIETVASGTESRGHRFYASEPFEALTLESLLAELRERKVEPNAAIRSERILAQAVQVADGKPEISNALLEENTFLCEWPTAIQGEFRPEFLALPDPVLVTAMAKHEKMFPVRNDAGELTNRFVFVRNSGEDDTVRAGCEWVLNARFNDAKFFFDEDLKSTLDEFLSKTESIVFQESLGTVRARADRIASLAFSLAKATSADEGEAELAERAGLYAKADLSTGLVSELSSLQGVIGAEYARREGFSPAVTFAIAHQYDSGSIPDAGTPESRTALRLVLAEALDKLAGYLGIGKVPSGSSDPFALRRAATTLIETAWKWGVGFPAYGALFAEAMDGYIPHGVALDRVAATRALTDLFASRYESLLPEVRYDILSAALLPDRPEAAIDPRGVRFRVAVLEALASDIALVRTATRPLNILAPARKKGVAFAETDALNAVDLARLDSDSGVALHQTLNQQASAVAEAARTEDVDGVVAVIRALEAPINAFFEGTMVMVEEEAVRYARLSLLSACVEQILVAGDVSRLAIEG